jgi:hypothetical protein
VDPEKKSLRAQERSEAKRAVWREQTRGVEPDRFVWIDETASHLGMTRRAQSSGARPAGVRDRPRFTREEPTPITALTLAGIGPGLLLDEAIDRETFDGRIIHRWPPPRLRSIVVVDNLQVHHSDRARAAIEARGAQLWYLPPYSPDLNPIEEAFSKVKTCLRSAAPRTLDQHSTAIWAALRTITPQDAAGWFAHAGYGTPRRQRPKRSARRRAASTVRPSQRRAPPAVPAHQVA